MTSDVLYLYCTPSIPKPPKTGDCDNERTEKEISNEHRQHRGMPAVCTSEVHPSDTEMSIGLLPDPLFGVLPASLGNSCLHGAERGRFTIRNVLQIKMQWSHEILPERPWKLTELSLGQAAAVDIHIATTVCLPVQLPLVIRPVDSFWYVLVY